MLYIYIYYVIYIYIIISYILCHIYIDYIFSLYIIIININIIIISIIIIIVIIIVIIIIVIIITIIIIIIYIYYYIYTHRVNYIVIHQPEIPIFPLAPLWARVDPRAWSLRPESPQHGCRRFPAGNSADFNVVLTVQFPASEVWVLWVNWEKSTLK